MDADAIRDLFAGLGEVRVRKMFGGQGVYRDDLMFGLEAGGELFLKADAETAGAFGRVAAIRLHEGRPPDADELLAPAGCGPRRSGRGRPLGPPRR